MPFRVGVSVKVAPGVRYVVPLRGQKRRRKPPAGPANPLLVLGWLAWASVAFFLASAQGGFWFLVAWVVGSPIAVVWMLRPRRR